MCKRVSLSVASLSRSWTICTCCMGSRGRCIGWAAVSAVCLKHMLQPQQGLGLNEGCTP